MSNRRANAETLDTSTNRFQADDDWLTRKQVAQILGFSLYTLNNWAAQGRGPVFSKVYGQSRYRVGDVRKWQKSHSKE